MASRHLLGTSASWIAHFCFRVTSLLATGPPPGFPCTRCDHSAQPHRVFQNRDLTGA
jgi:hypothetical protein